MNENKIKLLYLENQNVNTNPFTNEFNNYVLYEYLFKGTGMKPIEDNYYNDDKGRGFDASRVLAYFKIPNNDSNKNIYNGLSVEEVSEFLLSQSNVDYRKIGEVLSKKSVEDLNSSCISSFKKYYSKNIIELVTNERDCVLKREKFKKEYPIERINMLTLDEYALGGANFKKSLCYKLEFGEYKDAGPGIGGSTAAKFGIYKHSENEYYGRGNQLINNPEEFWQNFKYQLYMFLKEFGTCVDMPIRAMNKYPLLSGMGMVLTKLLYIYYPEKVLNICSKNKLFILMKYFGYKCDNNAQAEELSFLLSKNIRRDVPEVNNNDTQYLGSCLWHFIDDVINDKEENGNTINKKYTVTNFLDDVFMNENEYYNLKNLLEIKKNIILQGSPGVGKTFMAKRLAYSIIGEKNEDKILSVQFHQSYSYEDFIEGIRPNKNNQFELKDGVFKEFCEKAKNDKNNNYYCIIDEINRGNLSKILGELMLLIESDKRETEKVVLPYSGDLFYVPKNLYIIGMMNTADRSLALVDYALRRRFAFYEVEPAFSKPEFKKYLINKNNINSDFVEQLCSKFNKVNSNIEEDLNRGFKIGHSYFVDELKTDDLYSSYQNIIKYEIIPLLKEYWIDDEEKVKEYSDML